MSWATSRAARQSRSTRRRRASSGSRNPGGTWLATEDHRQHASALGSHRRQRRGVQPTGAEIAVHLADRHGLENPSAHSAPFPIPPQSRRSTWPRDRRSASARSPRCAAHAGPHRRLGLPAGRAEGCCSPATRCLPGAGEDRPGGWVGRADGRFPDPTIRPYRRSKVLPGHGRQTTLADERPWLEQVKQSRAAF